MAVKRGLGKGLDALFENTGLQEEEKDLIELKISLIEPNAQQPRKDFDEEQLQALSDSIAEHGIIQPIIVTPCEYGMYRIVAGERRWRAAKRAGLKTIPAIVRIYEDKQAAEVALLENLQRENLNPIEEAEGYISLIKTFGMTQEQVAVTLGKSRPAIANSIRLMSLPENLVKMVRSGLISGGHARALLSAGSERQRQELAERIIKEQLSVREVERIVSEGKKKQTPKPRKQQMPEIMELEKSLSEKIGTKVRISHGKKKGKIEIEYYGDDDFCRILEMMGQKI